MLLDGTHDSYGMSFPSVPEIRRSVCGYFVGQAERTWPVGDEDRQSLLPLWSIDIDPHQARIIRNTRWSSLQMDNHVGFNDVRSTIIHSMKIFDGKRHCE